MKQHYLFFPLLYLLLVLGACKKDDSGPESFSDKIVLKDAAVVNDSVRLAWSVLDNKDLAYYTVMRKTDPQGFPTPLGLYSRPTGQPLTTYTDKEVPYSSYLEYQVVATLRTGPEIRSNIIQIKRDDIQTIDAQPFDVRYDDQAKLLYFFSTEGVITQYNTQTKQVVKTLNTAATIGYCDFGMHNGIRELYVPRNDGWIFIYNARTLEKIDQLSVGSTVNCVVANNNQLFVASNSSGWPSRPLRVYGRADKKLIYESNEYWDGRRLILVPNTTTQIIALGGSYDQRMYSFKSDGTLLNQSYSGYYSQRTLDASLIEASPSGDRYVSSTAGAVYNRSLTYENSLPRGSKEFTAFAFDASGQLIYGATTTKSVEVYNATTYTLTRSIPTKAYPFRLFRTSSNELLCVSSAQFFNPYSRPSKMVIEMLK